MNFDQGVMRKYLQKAFKNEYLTPFPNKPIIGYRKILILRRERINALLHLPTTRQWEKDGPVS